MMFGLPTATCSTTQQKKRLVAVALVFAGLLVWLWLSGAHSSRGSRGGQSELKSNIQSTKWIVVTTIQGPTNSVRLLTQLQPDWRLVIVGDKKSPPTYDLAGAIFLDVHKQQALGYATAKYMPFNCYARKMIGYLYAIEHGAKFIFEIDDDNTADLAFTSIFDVTDQPIEALVVDTEAGFYNPLPHFGQSTVWPRGYPLEMLTQASTRRYRVCHMTPPAVQQGLASGNPDVDAIFRLTRSKDNLDIEFDSTAPPVVLPIGTYAPYNSQNTLFTWRSFWSLMLPITVSARVTDIYRAYWAQALLSILGDHVAHYAPTALQIRNPHNLAKDMKDEAVIYDTIYEYANFLRDWKCTQTTFFACVSKLSWALVDKGYWHREDGDILEAWLSDLSMIGYEPPPMSGGDRSKVSCRPAALNDVTFVLHPHEHNTSFFHTTEKLAMTDSSIAASRQAVSEFVSARCATPATSITLATTMPPSSAFSNILLVVGIEDRVHEVLALEAMYRHAFAHILYCGSVPVSDTLKASLTKWRISYTWIDKNFGPVQCVTRAYSIHFNVDGILYTPDNALLLPQSMAQKSKASVWITTNSRLDAEQDVTLCKDRAMKCHTISRANIETLSQRMDAAQLADVKLVTDTKLCLLKVVDSLKEERHQYLADTVFYIPAIHKHNLLRLAAAYDAPSAGAFTSDVMSVLLQCMDSTHDVIRRGSDVAQSDVNYMLPYLFSDVAEGKQQLAHRQHFCQRVTSTIINA